MNAGLEPDHHFEVSIEPDTFTEEKYQLFDNYQRNVHHEGDSDISKAGFKRFLCNSPLHRHDGGGKKLGSFHQMYRLDGRLIAMSVLDLLPHAVSGVYFIYHSDYEKFSFGKLSALREAALAVEGGHEYYYQGYYIHSCKKMRYKGDYKTQQVLDYDTGQWHPLDDAMRVLMEKRKWVSMYREREIRAAVKLARDTSTLSDAPTPNESEVEETKAREAYAVDYPQPLEAMDSALTLLDLHVPGATALHDLLRDLDPNKMRCTIGRGSVHEMQDLELWTSGSMTDSRAIRGIVTEFAACVGPEVAREVVVDFSYK